MSESAATTNTSTPLQRESSLGLEEEEEEVRGYEPEDGEDQVLDEDEGFNLPPGRMHATRSSTNDIRLKGNAANARGATMSLPNFALNANHNTASGDNSSLSSASSTGGRSKSGSNLDLSNNTPASPRSGSKTLHKLIMGGGNHTATTLDGNSSMSSLEDFVDSDILYDRAGLQEQQPENKGSKASQSGSGSGTNLPPVNERLSEDTLEDVHAFSDARVQMASSSGNSQNSMTSASRANSITTADKAFLDPLVEGEDEDGQDSLDGTMAADDEEGVVILTNMEKLSITAGTNLGGGEDSLAVAGASTLADVSETAPSQS
eukprot:CAMPEP_0172439736 /NCGR_PEP_ID=MMETSP1065-20121228/619_1 /TAXON_ID=265537 /ORGANISM="Amphiprora paludosa, Strain CCMP125" /LENGTH=318 /DNA_ID=CAMNT_0013188457 /DNA_START=126 /DNA_END=1082 /DNA_ORIENTATION=-